MAWLGFIGSNNRESDQLPDIFPIPISQLDFVRIDVRNIYTRILVDVLERTDGLPEDKMPLLWDNCLASENKEGLVTLIASAMADKTDLLLVYDPTTNVVRKAIDSEPEEIRNAYKVKAEPVKLGKGMIGLYVTFRQYIRSDMVKFYSALEFCAVGGLWKQANLSKSVQVKISDLRGSVSLGDSAKAKSQAKTIAEGMADGRDVLMDAKDVIESLTPDLTATDATLALIAKKQSNYTGMPASYFSGVGQATSMSDTGKADSKATDRGLKAYFFSIVKPILEGLFGGSMTFKGDNGENLEGALRVLETMDRTSSTYMSDENKTWVVNMAFGLDADETGDEQEEETEIDPLTGLPKVPSVPGAPAPFPPKPGQQPPPPKE